MRISALASRVASEYLGKSVSLHPKKNASMDSPSEHSISMEVILTSTFDGEAVPEDVMSFLTNHLNEKIREVFKSAQSQFKFDLTSLDVKPVNVEYEVISEEGDSSSFEAKVTPGVTNTEKDQILDKIMSVKHRDVSELHEILNRNEESEEESPMNVVSDNYEVSGPGYDDDDDDDDGLHEIPDEDDYEVDEDVDSDSDSDESDEDEDEDEDESDEDESDEDEEESDDYEADDDDEDEDDEDEDEDEDDDD